MNVDWKSIKTKKEALTMLVSSLSDVGDKQRNQANKHFCTQRDLHKEFLEYQKNLYDEILMIKEAIKSILEEFPDDNNDDIPLDSAFCAPKKPVSSKPAAGPNEKQIDGIIYRVGDCVEVTEPGKGFTDDPKFTGGTIVKFTEKRVYVQLQGEEKPTFRAFKNIRFMDDEKEDEENKRMDNSSHSTNTEME
jgi:hypothetical protein